jgi:hypothetical protein
LHTLKKLEVHLIVHTSFHALDDAKRDYQCRAQKIYR